MTQPANTHYQTSPVDGKNDTVTTPPFQETTLRFNWRAWQKMREYVKEAAPNEIGAYGILSPDDPGMIEDVYLLPQRVTGTHQEYDDEAIAKHTESLIDAGKDPSLHFRVLIHSHPWNGVPSPSGTDKNTLDSMSSLYDYCYMIILSLDMQYYAELRVSKPVKLARKMNIGLTPPPAFTDEEVAALKAEVKANILPPVYQTTKWDYDDGYGGYSESGWNRSKWNGSVQNPGTSSPIKVINKKGTRPKGPKVQDADTFLLDANLSDLLLLELTIISLTTQRNGVKRDYGSVTSNYPITRILEDHPNGRITGIKPLLYLDDCGLVDPEVQKDVLDLASAMCIAHTNETTLGGQLSSLLEEVVVFEDNLSDYLQGIGVLNLSKDRVLHIDITLTLQP